jgi:hypothetical protein
MPAWSRRSGRWIALATALVVLGAIGLALALRRGATGSAPPGPGSPPPPVVEPTSPPGRSGPPREPDPAAQIVRSAKAELAAGNLVQARTLLARAAALDPRPSTLLELAAVELRTGHCRDARRAAQRVVAAAPGEPVADQAADLLGKIGRCD